MLTPHSAPCRNRTYNLMLTPPSGQVAKPAVSLYSTAETRLRWTLKGYRSATQCATEVQPRTFPRPMGVRPPDGEAA